MDSKVLGERIKSRRESLKMSQEDLADLMEVSRVTISNWERGQRGIDATEMDKLASALKVRLEYFYDDLPETTVYILPETGETILATGSGGKRVATQEDIEKMQKQISGLEKEIAEFKQMLARFLPGENPKAALIAEVPGKYVHSDTR